MKISQENRKNSIDWSKPQLFINYEGEVVVMSTGEHSEGSFTGLQVNSNVFKDSWDKNLFFLYKGTISNG